MAIEAALLHRFADRWIEGGVGFLRAKS